MNQNKCWFVLLCKNGQDRKVEARLRSLDYTYYRPMTKKKRFSQSRKSYGISYFVSLFPRYIFIQLTMGVDDFSKITYLPGAVRFIVFDNRYAVVAESTINAIKVTEKGYLSNNDDACKHRKYEKICINSPGFENVEAIYKASKGANRSILLLNILGGSRMITIKDSYISSESLFGQK